MRPHLAGFPPFRATLVGLSQTIRLRGAGVLGEALLDGVQSGGQIVLQQSGKASRSAFAGADEYDALLAGLGRPSASAAAYKSARSLSRH